MSKLVCLVLFLIALTVQGLPARARSWTVRDTVEMSNFTEGPVWSPARDRFCLVTSRGVLATNKIESTIWLFEAARINDYLKKTANDPGARVLVKMAADTNEDDTNFPRTITGLKWAADGSSIRFLCRGLICERRLHSFDLKTGKCVQLTPDGQDVCYFDFVGDKIIYAVSKPPAPGQIYQAGISETAPDIVTGTGSSNIELLFPNWVLLTYGLTPYQIWQVKNGRPQAVLDPSSSSPVSFLRTNDLISVSPDGAFVVVRAHADRIPPAWTGYEPKNKNSTETFKADVDGGDTGAKSLMWRADVIKLLDLKSGKFTTLINAPMADHVGYHDDEATAVWSPDGSKVAIANTFFPQAPGEKSRLHPCVVVADPASRKVECVVEKSPDDKKQLPVWDLHWDSTGKILQIEGDGFVQDYKNEGGGWKPAGERRQWLPPENEIFVFVKQALNSPPALLSSFPEKGKSWEELCASKDARLILDPNPQFAGLELGQASVFTWQTPDGRQVNGGLVKPPDFKSNHRYPLLIQTHSFNDRSFFVHGNCATASPGRAMAARGVLVLQVNEPRRNSTKRDTPQEAESDGRQCYVAAIKELDRQGMIDPQKVGMIGYSHTGWYLLDCLINAPEYFKAATLADADSLSYPEFLSSVDLGAYGKNSISAWVGAEPFGKGMKTWLENSPGFNTDRIHAPLLYEIHSPRSLIFDWSIYPALRAQHKPVDLLYFRNGSHMESKPKNLFASLETNADWFDFWLNEHEDPDPAKAKQYCRWHELQKLQDDSGALRPN
jgi:hypothetical protein